MLSSDELQAAIVNLDLKLVDATVPSDNVCELLRLAFDEAVDNQPNMRLRGVGHRDQLPLEQPASACSPHRPHKEPVSVVRRDDAGRPLWPATGSFETERSGHGVEEIGLVGDAEHVRRLRPLRGDADLGAGVILRLAVRTCAVVDRHQ